MQFTVRTPKMAVRSYTLDGIATSSEAHAFAQRFFAGLDDYDGGYLIVGCDQFGVRKEITRIHVIAWVPEQFEDILPVADTIGTVVEA